MKGNNLLLVVITKFMAPKEEKKSNKTLQAMAWRRHWNYDCKLLLFFIVLRIKVSHILPMQMHRIFTIFDVQLKN